MKITRKFLPKYYFLVKWELLLFSILLISFAITMKRIPLVIAAILTMLLAYAISFFIAKKIAVGTKCNFYEDKLVYTFDFFIIHRKQVVNYKDINDIVYNQRFLQKKFGLGDISIILGHKGPFIKGIDICDVANVSEVFRKLTEVVGSKIF